MCNLVLLLPSRLSLFNGYGTWSCIIVSESSSKKLWLFCKWKEVVRVLKSLMGFICPEQPHLYIPAHGLAASVDLRTWTGLHIEVYEYSWIHVWAFLINQRSGSFHLQPLLSARLLLAMLCHLHSGTVGLCFREQLYYCLSLIVVTC